MAKLPYDDRRTNVISQTLMRMRKDRNLSQGELAARMQTRGVNIDQQMISKIEKNQRIVTDYELVCFCSALGVGLEEMLADFYREYGDRL